MSAPSTSSLSVIITVLLFAKAENTEINCKQVKKKKCLQEDGGTKQIVCSSATGATYKKMFAL